MTHLRDTFRIRGFADLFNLLSKILFALAPVFLTQSFGRGFVHAEIANLQQELISEVPYVFFVQASDCRAREWLT